MLIRNLILNRLVLFLGMSFSNCISSDNLVVLAGLSDAESVVRAESITVHADIPLEFSDSGPIDYSISTEDNFQLTENVEYVGKYSVQRSALDYTYHKHYIQRRQLFHDQVIDLFHKTTVRFVASHSRKKMH